MPIHAASILLIVAAGAPPQTKVDRQGIEAAVALAVIARAGALALSQYGQNYAMAENGQVVAVFLVPPKEFTAKTYCMDGSGKACGKSVRSKVAEDIKIARSKIATEGRKRWFASPTDLPNVADGGCSRISIVYDIRLGRVLSTACNAGP